MAVCLDVLMSVGLSLWCLSVWMYVSLYFCPSRCPGVLLSGILSVSLYGYLSWFQDVLCLLYGCLCVCVDICLSIWIWACISMSWYVSVWPSVCLDVSLSLYLDVCLDVKKAIWISIWISVCLVIWMSFRLKQLSILKIDWSGVLNICLSKKETGVES